MWIVRNIVSSRARPLKTLLIIEFLGMLTSPVAYKKAQIAAKRSALLRLKASENFMAAPERT
jgi:hypothetical protein